MQVPLHILNEVSVELIISIHHFAVHCCFLKLVDQSHIFLTFEQTRNLTTRQQGIHLLQESRGEAVTFIEDETNLFVFDTCSFHYTSKIFIEVAEAVITAGLNLEHTDTVDPRNETGEGGFTNTGRTDQ